MTKRLLILLVLSLVSFAIARVDVQCKVDGVQRSVQFVTGSELNQATSSFGFDTFSVYALLWYSQNQVAILRHTGFAYGVGRTFTVTNLEGLFRIGTRVSFREVNGDSERTAFIECKSYGRWIDPRLR